MLETLKTITEFRNKSRRGNLRYFLYKTGKSDYAGFKLARFVRLCRVDLMSASSCACVQGIHDQFLSGFLKRLLVRMQVITVYCNFGLSFFDLPMRYSMEIIVGYLCIFSAPRFGVIR